jgi:SAM-dependent methyltransferase
MLSINQKIQKLYRNPFLVLPWLYHKAVIKPRHNRIGRAFDLANGISTGIEVRNASLGALDRDSQNHATHYQAVPIDSLDMAFAYLARKPKGELHFVDIGCGKGRASFYASNHFERVTGIDFSPRLIDAANVNRFTFSGNHDRIKFEIGDARRFNLPDERCVVYLFHPFDCYIFKDFLDRNVEHFKKHRSRIVYVNHVCRELLLSSRFRMMFKTKNDNGISVYEYVG